MRLHWLDDVLTAAGLEVVAHPGWHDRGRELQSVERLICHHTATGPNWTDKRVVDLLVKGRPDLPGPLSQLGLDRDGRFHLIAAGKANHNGYGLSGNNTIGIEAFNDGKGELWLAVQMDAYIRGCAAICRHLGWPAEKVLGHKESDPGRKVDPTFDMPTFRGHVAALLTAPLPAPPQQEDDEMQFRAIRRAEDDKVALVAPAFFREVATIEELEALQAGGLTQAEPDEVNAVEYDRIKRAALNLP